MDGRRKRIARILVALTVLLAIAPAAGCVTGIPAQIGWMIWGLKKPAEYDGLKGKRVAVVVFSPYSQGHERGIRMLTSKIHFELDNNVKKIEMVPKSEVRDYVDVPSLSERRLLEIGRAVNADQLVVVKVGSYSLSQGSTLYKGKIQYETTVFDMEDAGSQVWKSGRVEAEYPKHGSVAALDTSIESFEDRFVNDIGLEIARSFFPFDLVDDYAAEHPGVDY